MWWAFVFGFSSTRSFGALRGAVLLFVSPVSTAMGTADSSRSISDRCCGVVLVFGIARTLAVASAVYNSLDELSISEGEVSVSDSEASEREVLMPISEVILIWLAGVEAVWCSTAGVLLCGCAVSLLTCKTDSERACFPEILTAQLLFSLSECLSLCNSCRWSILPDRCSQSTCCPIGPLDTGMTSDPSPYSWTKSTTVATEAKRATALNSLTVVWSILSALPYCMTTCAFIWHGLELAVFCSYTHSSEQQVSPCVPVRL